MVRRIFLIAFIFYFVSSFVYVLSAPEDVSVKSSLDKNKLSWGEPLTFRIEIKGSLKQPPEIKLPDLKDNFEILSSAQSQNISISANEKNQAAIFEYILLPKNAGRITIGEVEIKYEGKAYKTTPIEIEVSASKIKPQPSEPQEESPPLEENQATII